MSADKSKPGIERRTAGEWAQSTGHTRMLRDLAGCIVEMCDAEHGAAAALHGWSHHAYHAGAPLLLSRDDYLAAIEAARAPQKRPDGQSRYRPHPGACGAFFPHDLGG